MKVQSTLFVHKQRNKSYIFSVVFVINLNWRKVLFFEFKKKGWHPPQVSVRVTKIQGWLSSRPSQCAMRPAGRMLLFRAFVVTRKSFSIAENVANAVSSDTVINFRSRISSKLQTKYSRVGLCGRRQIFVDYFFPPIFISCAGLYQTKDYVYNKWTEILLPVAISFKRNHVAAKNERLWREKKYVLHTV